MKNKGFTLIELLVVVAIVGLLASVVLSSLQSSRAKGADAAIASSLKQLQSQASVWFLNNGSYGPPTSVYEDCSNGINKATGLYSDPTVQSIILYTGTKAGTDINGVKVYCYAYSAVPPADFWVVAATLKSDSTKSWCVDSWGQSKKENVIATAAITGAGCGDY